MKTELKIVHCASPWTLSEQPSADAQWSIEEQFAAAHEAGFEAMAVRCTPENAERVNKLGMRLVAFIDTSANNYQSRLEGVSMYNVDRINCQHMDHDTPPEEAFEVWMRLWEDAAKYGLQDKLDLEIHRDTCTETPEKTAEIIDRFKERTGQTIRLCWDFSHYAVVKHIYPPYADRLLGDGDLAHSSELIATARQIHLRPFNGHHCQIPVTDGQGNITPNGQHYLDFVKDLLKVWAEGNRGTNAEVFIIPEFGPNGSGYNLPEFPNPWQESIFLRGEIDRIWKELIEKA